MNKPWDKKKAKAASEIRASQKSPVCAPCGRASPSNL